MLTFIVVMMMMPNPEQGNTKQVCVRGIRYSTL